MVYEILPNLYLGDAKDAEYYDKNYSLVINCTKNIPFFTNNTCIRIPVDDNLELSEQTIIYNYWIDGRIFEEIDKNIRTGQNILVHCQMGRQRSAATVAAYIMYTLNWPMDRIINFIKSKKPDAFLHSINFQKALEQLEKTILH